MHRPDCGRPPIYPVLCSLWHVTFRSLQCHSTTSNPQSRLANHRDANPQPSQTPRHWGLLAVLGPLCTNRPTRSRAAPNLDPIREGHSGSPGWQHIRGTTREFWKSKRPDWQNVRRIAPTALILINWTAVSAACLAFYIGKKSLSPCIPPLLNLLTDLTSRPQIHGKRAHR
jgi:hypothetical protein